jgi:hypothetical protein
MVEIPESMCLLACSCGHSEDFEAFTRTPVNGDLPSGTYQCPKCRGAWRYEKVGTGTFYPSGLYVPADRRKVSIPTIL